MGITLVPRNPRAGPPVPESLTIHTAYRDRKLFIWGGCAPQKVSPGSLAFTAKVPRIGRAIAQVADQIPATYRKATIWLPTRNGEAIGHPEHSQLDEAIRPWTLSTAILEGENAFYFLDACNRNPHAESSGTKFAPSTRFWGAALRFVASLASRDRFVPSLSAQGEAFHARWKPLIAAPDRRALLELARAMPPSAHAITFETISFKNQGRGKPPEDDPAQMLSGFVEWLMDIFPRIANRSGRPRILPRETNELNVASVWMNRLCSMESQITGDRELLSGFVHQVQTWHLPVVRDAAFPWLLSFRLQEPDESAEDGAWGVQYMLEPVGGGAPVAVDKGALNRSSARHVTGLLARAATICADIREDSDSFPLDVTGAFRFLTETTAALEREGFRVAAPDWWRRHESAAFGSKSGSTPAVHARPILKPSSVSRTNTFSLDELMQFDWEIAIGGENYTREELDRLAESTAPLVKVHGKWLPFDPRAFGRRSNSGNGNLPLPGT